MSRESSSTLLEPDSFLLLAHHSPDIDSIASAVALASALRRRGKRVTISASGTVNGQIHAFLGWAGMALAEPDYSAGCVVVLDTNSPSLFDLGAVRASKARKVLIDHHSPKPEVMAEFDECIIDESAVSTTQIVYSLLRSLGEPITREVAIAVSAGIVTDSANFIAATPQAFRVLADALTEGKATFQDVLRSITVPMEQSERVACLKGGQRLEMAREGGRIIAWTKVNSFEGSVAKSLLALGADVAFVGAAKEGEVRISARARNELTERGLHIGRDILPAVAGEIGGDAGGHAAAAGANGIRPEALDKALSICVSRTRDFIQTL